MTWTMTQDLGAFEAAAGGFLRARPVAHTVLLSVAASLGRLGADAYGDGAPWCGSWPGIRPKPPPRNATAGRAGCRRG